MYLGTRRGKQPRRQFRHRQQFLQVAHPPMAHDEQNTLACCLLLVVVSCEAEQSCAVRDTLVIICLRDKFQFDIPKYNVRTFFASSGTPDDKGAAQRSIVDFVLNASRCLISQGSLPQGSLFTSGLDLFIPGSIIPPNPPQLTSSHTLFLSLSPFSLSLSLSLSLPLSRSLSTPSPACPAPGKSAPSLYRVTSPIRKRPAPKDPGRRPTVMS